MNLQTSSPEALSVLATGLGLVESIRWRQGRLWYADWSAGEIVVLDPSLGREVVATSPAPPLCFDFLADGTLLVASRDGRILRRDGEGALVTHADLRGLGVRWNEIVTDSRGGVYVNGAGYDPGANPPFGPGIIAYLGADGSVRQVAADIAFPNGMVVTPDNATLIIAESHGRHLTAFEIAEGGLSRRRVWADCGDGAPDGICLDAEGAIWYADVPNKRCVRVREGGEVLDQVQTDRGCFDCVLGGEDRQTLFIGAAEWFGMAGMDQMAQTGRLLAIRAPAPGVGGP